MKYFPCLALCLSPLLSHAGFVEPTFTSGDFTEGSYTDNENIQGFFLGEFTFTAGVPVDALGSVVSYGNEVITDVTNPFDDHAFEGLLGAGTYGVYLVHMDSEDDGTTSAFQYSAEVDFGATVLGVAFADENFDSMASRLTIKTSGSPKPLTFLPDSITSNFYSGNDNLSFTNASTLDFVNGVTELFDSDGGRWMNQAFLFFESGAQISPTVVPEPSSALVGVTMLMLAGLLGRRRR